MTHFKKQFLPLNSYAIGTSVASSVTRFGDLLDLGQLFKA